MTISYPRVSEILGPYDRFDHIDPNILEPAQIRGTRVHAALACFAKGIWSLPVPEEWKGYVESGKRWLSEYTKEIHLVEATLIDKDLGFQGTIDLLVTMIDGTVTLPDYKTSRTKSKLWAARMAAYRHLCIINGWPVQKIGTLRLKMDGSPATFDHYPIDENSFVGFHAALIAYKYLT